MVRMQEMAFPCFKFQKFSGGPPEPPSFMRGILATHVACSHCYPPLIYYLTEGPFSKNAPPPHGKILKKGPARKYISLPFVHNYADFRECMVLHSVIDFNLGTR
jgi:hypothetical protein